MLTLYNTSSRQVEDFQPQVEGQISLYTCGPTVYSEPLIGNWVAYIRWDILVRALRSQGLTVNRVMNITDVGHLTSDADDGEDKMEKGARREGKTAWEVADRYTNRFLEGMTALDLLPPEQLVKATEHITEQIDLIVKLEQLGHTYIISDGVYFDTSTFPTYGNFAKLDLDAQKAGARVEYNSEKRNPSDFALWKFSPKNEKRDMEWASPWGTGFPGWHIECSAMAMKYLGETIDIHTGGIDHIQIHHSNEIAQSEAVTGKRLANYWLHANFLTANGTKISKSLGNGFTLDDMQAKKINPMDFKLFVLQSHYRSESNFTWENVTAAANRLNRWRAVAVLRHQARDATRLQAETQSQFSNAIVSTKDAVSRALLSDMNTPQALLAIDIGFDFIEKQGLTALSHNELSGLFEYIDDVLGLKLISSTPDVSSDMKSLIAEREQAREQKLWEKSDQLRDTLAAEGIGLNDTLVGTLWYYL